MPIPGTEAEHDPGDAVARIARWFQRPPASVIRARTGTGFYAAKWRFPAHRRIATECVLDHTLCFNLSGAGLASKSSAGRTTRKLALPGAVTFAPVGETARYTLARESTLLELYIAPASLQLFSEECADAPREISIRPLFAEDDPWLQGYFRMLIAEMDLYGTGTDDVDSLLLGESRQLLLTYLLRRYSDLGRHGRRELDRGARPRRLAPPLLQRITEFVHQHLSTDIRLADLARLAHLSERHFIRAFYAATGVTPYRYVIEKRLGAAVQLLHLNDGRSMAEIALLAGFNSQSHFAAAFKARYRVTPREYRRLLDRGTQPPT